MSSSHVVGGGAAAFIGAVAVSLINRFFHSHVSDAEALVIGGAAVSLGAALGRSIEKSGVAGLVSLFLHGSKSSVSGS